MKTDGEANLLPTSHVPASTAEASRDYSHLQLTDVADELMIDVICDSREYRVARNIQAYTHTQFLEYYGPEIGRIEWKNAPLVTNAIALLANLYGMPSPLHDHTQRRVARDRTAYTFTEFLAFYGPGKACPMWEEAPPLSAEPVLNSRHLTHDQPPRTASRTADASAALDFLLTIAERADILRIAETRAVWHVDEIVAATEKPHSNPAPGVHELRRILTRLLQKHYPKKKPVTFAVDITNADAFSWQQWFCNVRWPIKEAVGAGIVKVFAMCHDDTRIEDPTMQPQVAICYNDDTYECATPHPKQLQWSYHIFWRDNLAFTKAPVEKGSDCNRMPNPKLSHTAS